MSFTNSSVLTHQPIVSLLPVTKSSLQTSQVASGSSAIYNGHVVKRIAFSLCAQLNSYEKKMRSRKGISCFSNDDEIITKQNVKKAAPVVASDEKKRYVGIAVVQSKKDGSFHPICIRKAIYALPEECYQASLLPSEEPLGYIAFRWLRTMPDGNYGCEERVSWKEDEGYGFHKTCDKLNKIYVTMLTTDTGNQLYKGIGSALMQAATEWGYDHGCDGRTSLLAIQNSHGFYYKLGMRCHKASAKEKDTYIAEELERAKAEDQKPNTQALGLQSVDMYAPPEAIEKMKAQIALHRIF